MDHTPPDAVVVGAGISGLVTGTELLERRPEVDVLLVEKGTRAGGTSIQSGGAFYCPESLDDLRERDPPGDRRLQEIVVRQHREAWDWLEEHGVPLRDVSPTEDDFERVLPECRELIERKRVAKRVDTEEMIAALVDAFESAGGELALRTAMQDLRIDDSGTVTGIVAATPEGRFEVRADAVVLATGGYPGNEQLVEENFFTENSESIWLRASKWCTGDGILAAEDAGAKRSRGNNRFYGKSMIAPPAEFTPYQYPEATAYYGPFSIALDESGERFADESESIHEHSVIRAAARRGYGRIYYVFDSTLAESVIQPTKDVTVREQFERQRELGATTATATTLDELAAELTAWGVDGDTAIETIAEYNDAIRSDDGADLDPPRKGVTLTFDEPPWYAVAVQPSITLTLGGLDVTDRMEVLDRRRSGSQFTHAGAEEDPRLVDTIDGLYAVGADVGNVGAITLVEGMGPMTANAVFGRIAANAITETINDAP